MAHKNIISRTAEEVTGTIREAGSMTQSAARYVAKEAGLYSEGFALITAPARKVCVDVFNKVSGHQRYLDRGLAPPDSILALCGGATIGNAAGTTLAIALLPVIGPVGLVVQLSLFVAGGFAATQLRSLYNVRAHDRAQLANQQKNVAALPDQRCKAGPST